MALPEPGGNVRWVVPARPMNLLLLALVPACFALNPVIGRALADVLGPATPVGAALGCCRLLIAALALARGKGERWQAPRAHLLRVACSACWAWAFAPTPPSRPRAPAATNIGLIYGVRQRLGRGLGDRSPAASAPTGGLLLGIAACLVGAA